MPRRWYYHASHPDHRFDIVEEGLSGWEGGPVFLFKYRDFAEDYIRDEPMDVFKVDGKGLRLEPDAEDPEAAVYTFDRVASSRVRYVGTYLDGERIPFKPGQEDW